MEYIRDSHSPRQHDSEPSRLQNEEIENPPPQCINSSETNSLIDPPFHGPPSMGELDFTLSEYDFFMSQQPGVPLNWPENEHLDDSLQELLMSNHPFFPDSQEALSPLSALQNEQSAHTSYSDLAGVSPPSIPQGSLIPSLTPGNAQPMQQDLHNFLPTQNSSGTIGNEIITHPGRPANLQPSLPRRRSRYLLRRSENQVIPKFIPNSTGPCDPLQRWRNSPPEDEPASISAIAHALNNSQNIGGRISDGKDWPAQGQDSQFHGYRRPTSLASSNSGSSASSWQSVTSTRSSTAQDPLAPQDHRGHRRINKSRRTQKKPDDPSKRIFCCTFCCDRFKNKYDWVRHEKSLHLNLESWVCAPHGIAPISPLTGRRQCAYCLCLEPSVEHLNEHNSQSCSEGTRTFRRKDHLVQHLRQFHQLEALPSITDWKKASPDVTSRCGFCDHRLSSWDERSEHLASHFREGLTMNEWRGDHDFPPFIASSITNALPVYLIGSESKTMVPFSATNYTVKDHFAQISTRADSTIDATADRHNEAALASSFQQLRAHDTPLNTFTQLLTSHLARYSRKQMSLGVLPTDEMFQRESRRLLYDSEDPWNQTIADNPEWISAFKQKYVEPTDAVETAGQTAPHAMEPLPNCETTPL